MLEPLPGGLGERCVVHGVARPSAASLHPVVGRFLGDLHVVHVALADPGRGDLHELGLVVHLVDGGAAAIAHGRAQAAGHLEHDGNHRALVRHAPFDALGHELVGVGVGARVVLEVAVGTALLHGADGAHAAVALVAAALEQHDLAGRLFGAGEHASHHHAVGAGRDGLGDVARVADAAV